MLQKLSRANVLALIMVFYAQMRVQSKSVKTLCFETEHNKVAADFLSSDEEENY